MMTNKKTGSCCWCGLRLEPGQGYLFHVDEEDECLGFGPMGATGWLVSCPDRVPCRQRITDHREVEKREHEERARVDALERDLFPLADEFWPGWVEGDKPHQPWGGEEYERPGRGFTIYGGGECYIVTPDQAAQVWKLRNNGSDGDDWGRNNVRTGGAGAIGYLYPATPERLAFLANHCENVSEQQRQDQAAETARKAARLDYIRPALQAMIARGVSLADVEKAMKPGQHTFCPRELVVAGKAATSIRLGEARDALGL